MAVLKKLEYFISSTSENTTQDAIDKIKAELNRKQALASNKVSETEFKNLYFAGFFDPRSLKQFLIFSNATKDSGGLSAEVYDLSSGGVSDEKLQQLIDNSPVLANFVTRDELESIINADCVSIDFINSLGENTNNTNP